MIANGEAAIVFLDGSTAVAGPAAAVRAAVDQAAKRSPMPAALAALVRTVPSSDQMWAVSLGGLPGFDFGERSNFANLGRALAAITSARASADLSRGLRLTIEARYSGEAEAKQVHGALKALIGLGRLTTPESKRDLMRFYDAFDIRLEAATVRVNADISTEVLEEGLKQFDPRAYGGR